MLKVMFFTDQPVLAEGIRSVFLRCDGLQFQTVPWRSGNAGSAAMPVPSDIYLVDVGPETDLPALEEFAQQYRQGRIVLLARSLSPELVYHARELGVEAVISSRSELSEIVDAVLRVHAGEFVFDESLTCGLNTARTVNLTPREGQLVALLAQGLKNKEIAATLGITEGTVKVYFSKLFRKVGAKDRFELALFGVKNMANPAMGFTEEPPKKMVRPISQTPVRGLHTLVMRMGPEPVAPPMVRAVVGL